MGLFTYILSFPILLKSWRDKYPKLLESVTKACLTTLKSLKVPALPFVITFFVVFPATALSDCWRVSGFREELNNE